MAEKAKHVPGEYNNLPARSVAAAMATPKRDRPPRLRKQPDQPPVYDPGDTSDKTVSAKRSARTKK